MRSLCNFCGVGCTLFLSVHQGAVKKVTSRVGEGVNNGSLCAVGRFGFGCAGHPARIKAPLMRKEGALVEVSWEEALGSKENLAKWVTNQEAAEGDPKFSWDLPLRVPAVAMPGQTKFV